MALQDLSVLLASASPEFMARLKAWADAEELKVLRLGCVADAFAHGRTVGAAQVYRTISDALKPRGIGAPPVDENETFVFTPESLA